MAVASSKTPVETTFDHLPATIRMQVAAGGQFVDLGDKSPEYAKMFGFPPFADGGILSLRGIHVDGCLAAVVALYEQKKMFGTRAVERFAPFVALFELGYARLAEREARDEAVRTLEDVTQRVHGEYVRRLAELENELIRAKDEARAPTSDEISARIVALEKEVAKANEQSRKAKRHSDEIEGHVTAAVSQLEQAHVELHRRSESLRQRTRTLYLIERVLKLDATVADPRQLVDGLLALVGDDMQAQRCSLMLRCARARIHVPRGVARARAPHRRGSRIPIGTGVAGRVAQAREPLLVQDVAQAHVASVAARPALHDRLVHQLSARVPGRARRRGEPDESGAVRRIPRGGHGARAAARSRDRARRHERVARRRGWSRPLARASDQP